MANRSVRSFLALVALLTAAALHAKPRIARRLGNPRTRFADPLKTPQDLRDRLTSAVLKKDVEVILNLCDGWRGSLADFRQAAATVPVTAFQIPVGAHMPAMSARKNGRPILHRDLVWGGKEPIDAYEFFFYSNGQHYRCVTPKPCCNFWVEHVGTDRRAPILQIVCQVPQEVLVGRRISVCLTVKNTGEVSAESVTVRLPIPEGANYIDPAGKTNTTTRRVAWPCGTLAPGKSKMLCADFVASQPGPLRFAGTAQGTRAKLAETWCSTLVTGIPAILFEVIDLEDPIEVGSHNTYELRVVNQGSISLTNLRLVCSLEDSQAFVSGDYPKPVEASAHALDLTPLPSLRPKATATWRVVVKALAAGDVRFSAKLSCNEFERPVAETEATHQY